MAIRVINCFLTGNVSLTLSTFILPPNETILRLCNMLMVGGGGAGGGIKISTFYTHSMHLHNLSITTYGKEWDKCYWIEESRTIKSST